MEEPIDVYNGRPMKELLKLMLKHVRKIGIKRKHDILGLCGLTNFIISKGKINQTEFNRINKYIEAHRPHYYNSPWGWTPGLMKPRRSWLKKHIKIINSSFFN